MRYLPPGTTRKFNSWVREAAYFLADLRNARHSRGLFLETYARLTNRQQPTLRVH